MLRLSLVAGFVLLSGAVFAADLQKGAAAYAAQDFASAYTELMPLAGGNAEAAYYVGMMYSTGKGVAQDFKESAKWLRKSAEAGNAYAQFNLAQMFGKGQGGLPQRGDLAQRWYQRSADQGYAPAQNVIGITHATDPQDPDYKAAAEWLRKAADQGDIGAQYNLAQLYLLGLGVNKDEAEAMRWLIKASTPESRTIHAYIDLSRAFRVIGEQHYTNMYSWELSNEIPQLQLAGLYSKAQNYVEAARWLARPASLFQKEPEALPAVLAHLPQAPVVKPTYVYVRPDAAAEAWMQAPVGTTFRVLSQKDGWAEVYAGKVFSIGWVPMKELGAAKQP